MALPGTMLGAARKTATANPTAMNPFATNLQDAQGAVAAAGPTTAAGVTPQAPPPPPSPVTHTSVPNAYRLGDPTPTTAGSSSALSTMINDPSYGVPELTGQSGGPLTPDRQRQSAPPPGSNAPPGEMYGPQFGEKYGMEHIGQYDTPTSLETFAQQQMTGNNPYYDRLQKQGMDALNQQMVARGHGNSGGALAALGNFQGALGAEQFKDMGNLLQGAGAQGLQRERQGNDVATGVQGMQRNRTQDQFNNLLNLTGQGVSSTGQFFNQGGNQSGDAAMAAINAWLNKGQLEGQGSSAIPNFIMQLINGGIAKDDKE